MNRSYIESRETKQATQLLIPPSGIPGPIPPPVIPASPESEGADESDPLFPVPVPPVSPPSSESDVHDDCDSRILCIKSAFSPPTIVNEYGFRVSPAPTQPVIAVEANTISLSPLR